MTFGKHQFSVDIEPIFTECHEKALDKLAHFAECPSQGTRQTCPLCRVSRRYYTRQSSRHRYPSVPLAFFFAEGHLDTRQSVCRVPDGKHSANTPLPSKQ